MPGQTQKASFAAKFGDKGKAAAAAGAKAPVDYGRRELPAGITNGVARLINAELTVLDDKTGYTQLDGSSAKGELVLTLTAAVETPKTHFDNGSTIKTEGMQFRKWCPIFTKGARGDFGAQWDFDECVKQAAGEMRKIAGEDFDTSDFDAAVKALANAKPKLPFLFSTVMGKEGKKIDPKTKKPYPPRLNVYWNGSQGLVDNGAPPDSGVDDQTGGEASTGDENYNADGAGEAGDGEQMTLAEMAAIVDANPDKAEQEGTQENLCALELSKAAEEKWGEDVDLTQFDGWVAIVEAIEAPDEPEPEPEPPKPAPAPKKATPKPAPKAAAKPAPKSAPKPAPRKK